MGVVYKLKKEVAAFIVHQKKQNPALSCRGLVDIVEQHFPIRVSKSSVNNILQEASLSSSVGRRTSQDKKVGLKKFQIPEEKKKQLFPASKDRSVAAAPPLHKKNPAPPLPPAVSLEEKKKASPHKEQVKERAAPVRLDLPRERILHDGAGAFLLKAAQWDLAGGSILGKFLKGQAKGTVCRDLDAAAEALTFAPVFGINNMEEFSKYEKQGLWALAGAKMDAQAIKENFKDMPDFANLSLNFSVDIPPLFAQMNSVKLFLEDKTEVGLDAQMTTPRADNVHSGFPSSINKTLSVIAKQLVNNVQSVMLCGTSSRKDSLKDFYSFVSACENIPGKRITRIAAYDQHLQEMVSFNSIPEKKRTFISGLWPWQDEFNRLVKGESASKKSSWQIDALEKTFYLNEIVVPLLEQKVFSKDFTLRAFPLRISIDGDPVVIIVTNASSQTIAGKDIVLSYLLRWPNLEEGFNIAQIRNSLSAAEEQAVSKKEESSLVPGEGCSLQGAEAEGNYDVILDAAAGYEMFAFGKKVLALLDCYCQNRFFLPGIQENNANSILPMLYDTPGYLSINRKFLLVELLLTKEKMVYQKELEHAVKRVNESDILDPENRQILLKLTHPL